MTTLLSAQNVTKAYSDKIGIQNLSFELKAGQVLGLLGHNGAGKSTLIQSLLGAHHYQGEIRVNGCHPIHDHTEMMNHLSYISDVNVLPDWMTVKQLLKYTSGVHPNFDIHKANQTLEATDIKPNTKIKHLSKGMKVQLHLAVIIATDTKVLILDEPTLGLDLIYRETFYRHLLEWFHDGERALIIASHEVAEIEHLITDVFILKQGQCVLNESMESIEEGYFVIDAPNTYQAQIEALQPLSKQAGLGSTKWLLKSHNRNQIESMGTIYPVKLADLFLATQMGMN